MAQRAQDAGLLSDTAIRQLLEDAMRRQAGRKRLALADELQAANIAPISDEEIVARVKEARTERRTGRESGRAGRS